MTIKLEFGPIGNFLIPDRRSSYERATPNLQSKVETVYGNRNMTPSESMTRTTFYHFPRREQEEKPVYFSKSYQSTRTTNSPSYTDSKTVNIGY